MVKRPAYGRFFRFWTKEGISLRTAFFVDGYNLYYGLLHGTAYKWLDVRALLSTILKVQDPRSEVSAIHYFTSLVKPDLASRGVESLTAQKTYIRALVATNIVVTEGKHRLDKAMAPEYVNDQKASRQQQVAIWSLEEKQTDVNIAIAMYRTAVKQQELPEHEQITQLVLVSNDSDFSPAIKAVREDFPNMRIGVIAPIRERAGGDRPPSGSLTEYADWVRKVVRNDELASCLFPDKVPTRKKPALKPDYW